MSRAAVTAAQGRFMLSISGSADGSIAVVGQDREEYI